MISIVDAVLGAFRAEALDNRIKTRINEKVRQGASPPRWNTLEFYFYALCFVFAVPAMFSAAMAAGSPSHPNFPQFEHLLSPGWMGKYVDNSDLQYSGFRSQFRLLLVLMGVHLGFRRILPVSRPVYDLSFGLLVLLGLHGMGGMLKILTILILNRFLINLPKYPRIATWIFGVAILFANELLDGYPIPFLDGGLLPQWQVFFKCTMLRMISFNMDYLDERRAERTEFTWKNYIAYALYTPLYLAGPVFTFAEYIAQIRSPPNTRALLPVYVFRFIVCMLTMEFVLHYIPVNAISSTRAWDGDTPAQVSMIGFFNLVVIWLKLLLPWRFFRLWALLDGIDPPENMIRCVANNYSALSFWRSWHRSFHFWVTKYLYVPLGGSKRPLINSVVVFAFVALWHDIQLRLFVWGGLIILFVIPEMVMKRLIPFAKYGHHSWYRIASGAGAVANIWMMLIANLVGFAVGPEGIRHLLGEMLSTVAGLRFAIVCSLLLFVGAQTMFELRQREHRNGIDLKC